jgi:hypothetical protein
MELKKRHTGLYIVLTVLLTLLLSLVCWLATGPRSLTPHWFRYGFYPLESQQIKASVAIQRMAGDGIITDRNADTKNTVTYTYNSRTEAVLWRVYSAGLVVEWLEANALSVWTVCAALALVVVLLWSTAPRRRTRRMQAAMKKTFQTCGAHFEQEDESIEY